MKCAGIQYNETLGGYEQWLYLKEQMVSYIGAKTGKSKGFYTDVECQGSHTGIVAAHGSYTFPTLSTSLLLPISTLHAPRKLTLNRILQYQNRPFSSRSYVGSGSFESYDGVRGQDIDAGWREDVGYSYD
ncbi:hypothetical protein FKW77_009877 [Venturia effusa]|uniref:Uncharacterized protein n=1 Tax=Venturia effusa TaxID=50376 RepID=A0A517L0A9_9PEZI|nr:hypothetical protein FKW77_009877 [Venturia effusa]